MYVTSKVDDTVMFAAANVHAIIPNAPATIIHVATIKAVSLVFTVINFLLVIFFEQLTNLCIQQKTLAKSFTS